MRAKCIVDYPPFRFVGVKLQGSRVARAARFLRGVLVRILFFGRRSARCLPRLFLLFCCWDAVALAFFFNSGGGSAIRRRQRFLLFSLAELFLCFLFNLRRLELLQLL